MLKFWTDDVWAFDVEWVPCVETGRRMYGLYPQLADDEVIKVMYAEAKDFHPENNPRPYLKTALCRVVSIGVAKWKRGSDFVRTRVLMGEEREILQSFLGGHGASKPMLVGFNSRNADLPILLQRAVANEVVVPQFCHRAQHRDFFHRYSGWHVDLAETLGGYGSSMSKLAELCAAAGIPCKTDTDGSQVAELWRAGETDRIRRYQEADALSTLALFLRCMHMAGQHPTGRLWLEPEVLDRHPEWRAYTGQKVAA